MISTRTFGIAIAPASASAALSKPFRPFKERSSSRKASSKKTAPAKKGAKITAVTSHDIMKKTDKASRSKKGRFVSETPPRADTSSAMSVTSDSESEASMEEESSSSLSRRALEMQIAQLRRQIHEPRRSRKSESRSRSRSYRDRYESSSDSEEEQGERVSFVHNEDNKPFLKLHERYRAVSIKYFKQIFSGIFLSKNLSILASSCVN